MPEGWIHGLTLIPLIYLGIVTSIEDFRRGKISRRYVRLGALFGLLWLVVMALFQSLFLDRTDYATQVLPAILLQTALALAVSGGMWWFNVWSGADAKLFTVDMLLLPPTVLGLALKAPVILLVNTYAAAFCLISLDFAARLLKRGADLWRVHRKRTKAERDAAVEAVGRLLIEEGPAWVRTLLGFTFMLLLIRILRQHLLEWAAPWVQIDQTLIFLFFFLAFRPFHRLFQMTWVTALVIASLVGYLGYLLYLDPAGGRLAETASIGLWSLGFMVLRQVYSAWAAMVETRRIPIESLREHQILPETVRQTLVAQEVCSKEDLALLGVEGLPAEFVQRIRELYRDPEQPGTILVENTIPFAPFLFAGVLLTLLVGGVAVRLG